MAVQQRTTKRKSLIEKILAEDYMGGPVLLEELRWKVLIQQYGQPFVQMSDSNQKSFARTIREHMSRLKRRRIPISDAPAGMVARASLYRIESREKIERFLNSEQRSVFFNVGFPDHERRGEDFQRVTIGCYFLIGPVPKPKRGILNQQALARVIIPKSHSFTLVGDASHGVKGEPIVFTEPPGLLYFFARHPDSWRTWGWSEEIDPKQRIPIHEMGLS
ncbi:MAG TPA: hypothetical protein VHU84_06650 [Lacipirellulaceae bacterium]|jgi:hypothetical protein|nr:hypothetical protein [Lacipirellulaceae bacterium]